MGSGGSGSVAALRRRISGLRRAKRFVRYGESSELARDLQEVVATIEREVLSDDAAAALTLVESFLRTDDITLNRVDDSSGSVGAVYVAAARLWLRAAAAVGLPGDRTERLLELAEQDGYGVREPLLREANLLLSEHELRRLAAHFEEAAQRAVAESSEGAPASPAAAGGSFRSARPFNRELLGATSSLSLVAEALRDPALYERSCSIGGPLNDLQLAAVARRYMAYGRPHDAIDRLRRIPESSRGDRWRLLAECYEATGQDDLRLDCLWRLLEHDMSPAILDRIETLTLGPDRQAVRRRAMTMALESDPAWVGVSGIMLLVHIDAGDDAERLMVKIFDELARLPYTHLLALVESAAEADLPRVEILAYRRLMLDILQSARSTIYHHAVRYLGRLQRLDERLDDYGAIATHADFLAALQRDHGRKYAFWRLVEERGLAHGNS